MPSPSPTIQPPLTAVTVVYDPSQSWNSWMYYKLSGVNSPGTIIRGGVQGFKRETGWDIKKGKGTQGATLTLKDMPPVEGTITCQLVTPQDFTDYDNFVSAVLSIDVKDQQQDGLAIYYPEFAGIGLTTVVVKHYTGPKYQGKGVYHFSVELIEWQPPPNVNIVATVAATAPDNPSPDSPPTEDPRITALEAQIAAAQQANKP